MCSTKKAALIYECFLCEYFKLLKSSFLEEHLLAAASDNVIFFRDRLQIWLLIFCEFKRVSESVATEIVGKS